MHAAREKSAFAERRSSSNGRKLCGLSLASSRFSRMNICEFGPSSRPIRLLADIGDFSKLHIQKIQWPGGLRIRGVLYLLRPRRPTLVTASAFPSRIFAEVRCYCVYMVTIERLSKMEGIFEGEYLGRLLEKFENSQIGEYTRIQK